MLDSRHRQHHPLDTLGAWLVDAAIGLILGTTGGLLLWLLTLWVMTLKATAW